MYYPVTDYIALALIISFLFLTLFICLLCLKHERIKGNDSNLLIVFYVQIMPDDFVMQLHRF